MILQIIGRSARPPEMIRLDRPSTSVGRAFSNDIVVADPFVAAEQIKLGPGGDSCRVEILDQTNPVILNGEPILDSTAVLKSGDRITIGRTELRLFAHDHPIEPTRKLLLSSWTAPGRVAPAIAIFAWFSVSVADAGADYLQFATDLKWGNYAYGGLVALVLILLWAGQWAIVGRVLRHQPHFFVQLLSSSLIFAVLVIVFPLAAYLEFATSSAAVGEAAHYAIGFTVMVALLRLNLSFATNIRNTTLAATLVAATVTGLIFATLEFAKDKFDTTPAYSSVVKPPFAQLRSPESIDDFIERAESLEL